MKCAICKQGDTHPGKVTVTLERAETIVVIKEVPADVCENCGEYYLSESITERLLQATNQAADKGAEVEIIRFAA